MLVALDQSVPMKDLGGTGVDPKKEEPLISQHSGNIGKVLPNVTLSSMLENLNRNEISESLLRSIRSKVSNQHRKLLRRTPRHQTSYAGWCDCDAGPIRTSADEP